MNRKQFLLVLTAMALIGAAGLILLKRHQHLWAVHEAKAGDKVLPHFRFNDVAAIRIRGDGEVNVMHTNGVWRVRERGGYPANYPQIKELLLKLGNLKVVQSEMVGPSQLARVSLTQPGAAKGSGVLVEFADAQGKLIDSLLVGKEHERQPDDTGKLNLNGLYNGRYVLVASDPANVLLIADPLASVKPDPETWLNRDFFKPDHVASVAVTFASGAGSWKIARPAETAPWTLESGKPGEVLNVTAAAQAVEILSFLSFADVLPSASGGGSESPVVLNAATFDGFNYTLKISGKQPDGNYHLTATVANKKAAGQKELGEKLAKEQALMSWVYVVNASIIESLTPERAQLLEQKTAAGEQRASAQ